MKGKPNAADSKMTCLAGMYERHIGINPNWQLLRIPVTNLAISRPSDSYLAGMASLDDSLLETRWSTGDMK